MGEKREARSVLVFLSAAIASTFFIRVTFGLGYPLTALTFETWGQRCRERQSQDLSEFSFLRAWQRPSPFSQ
jgi:hypothetical protein